MPTTKEDLEKDFAPPAVESAPAPLDFQGWVKDKTENSPYMSSLESGDYRCKFLGADMIADKFNPGQLVPEYRFELNGMEKTLSSGSKKLWALKDRVGMEIVIRKGMTADNKTQWSLA